MATRIFLMGAIILFFGTQFRVIDTFVLNEQVTKFVNKRLEKTDKSPKADSFEAGLWDPYLNDTPKTVSLPTNRRITPPRWLGWSLLSMGAVLILTSPLFRTH